MDPKKPTLLARLKYEGQSQQPLRDLHTSIDSTTTAKDFLHQFISFRASLSEHPLVRKHYGGVIQQLLSSAAIFQLKWLPKPQLEDISDESHLIMLALHCLIGTIELAELTQWHKGLLKFPTPTPDRMGGAYIKPELKKATVPSEWPQDPSGKYPLVHTLQRVIQAAYRILLRGNAEDWPLFYYTFFILRGTAWNLRQIEGITTAFQGAGSKLYNDIEVKLGEFAKYVTKGNELYRQEFDIKKYELLVSNPGLREECVHLNKLWTAPLENREVGNVIP